ncbi:MAG: hypothetical protein ACLURG_11455 [Gemmiger sp.]
MRPYDCHKAAKEEHTMTFSDKLIALRKKAGWSQEELAEERQSPVGPSGERTVDARH